MYLGENMDNLREGLEIAELAVGRCSVERRLPAPNPCARLGLTENRSDPLATNN